MNETTASRLFDYMQDIPARTGVLFRNFIPRCAVCRNWLLMHARAKCHDCGEFVCRSSPECREQHASRHVEADMNKRAVQMSLRSLPAKERKAVYAWLDGKTDVMPAYVQNRMVIMDEEGPWPPESTESVTETPFSEPPTAGAFLPPEIGKTAGNSLA